MKGYAVITHNKIVTKIIIVEASSKQATQAMKPNKPT